jgi:hypothetical protein
LEEEKDITKEGIEFYRKILREEVVSNNVPLFQNIPCLISQGDNSMLMATFTLEELKLVVFGMDLDKSPSLDGFTSFFF